EFGVDSRCDKLLEPIGLRFLQRAADIVLGDRDLRDLVFIKQCLKTAVRDWRELCALDVKILDQQHREHGGDDVPEVDVKLLVQFIHGRTLNLAHCPFASRMAQIERNKLTAHGSLTIADTRPSASP